MLLINVIASQTLTLVSIVLFQIYLSRAHACNYKSQRQEILGEATHKHEADS